MSQLFPTIYLSFDGFQRRQLKQDLHTLFNQSPLNQLGFKLKLSPRTVVDFGTPDSQQACEICRQSALFVALLEESAGHGARQQLLHAELGHAMAEPGTKVLLLSEVAAPNLPSSLSRLLEHQGGKPVQVASEQLAQSMLEQMEQVLCGALQTSNLSPVPEDFSVAGLQPTDRVPAQDLLLQKLLGQELAQNNSPDQANLLQHKHWLTSNLSLNNSKGALQSIQHCLSFYDSDLMANYWRCRLLAPIASKEAEYLELIERSQLVIRHFDQQQFVHDDLRAECGYFQAQGYVGLHKLDDATQALNQALLHQESVPLLHQLALRTLQRLAQQQTPPERHDPALISAKKALLSMLKQSVLGYQLSTQQLLIKTPKDKLDMVMLGVKQDVVAALRQLQPLEQEFKHQCAEWDLIVTPSTIPENMQELIKKPVWNLIQIGQDCVERQLTLLQLLAHKLVEQEQDVAQLEQESNQLNQQQQQLNDAIGQLQFSYQDTCKSRKLCWWGLVITGLLVSTLISGFWWISLAPSALIFLLTGDVLAFGLLALLTHKQEKRLASIQQQCRSLDLQFGLKEDDLPEPRAQEGWFDRLSVRRDKLRDKIHLLKAKSKEKRTLLQQRIPVFAQCQLVFSKLSLSILSGAFNPWPPTKLNTPFLCRQNKEQVYALPPFLAQQVEQLPDAPLYLLFPEHDHATAWASYFDATPNPIHCKSLHLLQSAANHEPITELVHVPSHETPWQLNKWLVAEGEDVLAQQPLAELQSEEQVISLASPKAGRINRQLASEGNDLLFEQAVVELHVN